MLSALLVLIFLLLTPPTVTTHRAVNIRLTTPALGCECPLECGPRVQETRVQLPEVIGKRSEGVQPTGVSGVGIGQTEGILEARTTEVRETIITSAESAAGAAILTATNNVTKPKSIPRQPESVASAAATQVPAPTITKTVESQKKNAPTITTPEERVSVAASSAEPESTPILTGPRPRNPAPNSSDAAEKNPEAEDRSVGTSVKRPAETTKAPTTPARTVNTKTSATNTKTSATDTKMSATVNKTSTTGAVEEEEQEATRLPPPPHRKGSPKTIVTETTDQMEEEEATSSLSSPSRKANTKTILSVAADEGEEEQEEEPVVTTMAPPRPPRKANIKTTTTEAAKEETAEETLKVAPRPTQATVTEQETVIITVSPSRHPPRPKAQTKTAYVEDFSFADDNDEWEEEEELPPPPRKHSKPKNKPDRDFMTGDDVVWSTETFIEEIIGPSVTKTSVLELVVVQHTSTSMAEATGKAREKEQEHRMQTADAGRNGVALWTTLFGTAQLFAVAVIAAL